MVTDLARQDDAHNTALANPEEATSALTHYLGTGDLSRLSGEQRAALYLDTCQSLGINPRTRPFDWIEFYDPETKSKKLTLYPNKACADQLAYQHRIRVRTVEEKIVGSLFKVVVEGTMLDGRTETNVSYLDLTDRDGNQLKGQRLGNAFMKGHTKAKRRLVFGMLGMMSPPDVEDLQRVRVVTVDGRGNILANPTDMQRALAERPEMARVIGETTYEDLEGTPTVFDGSPSQHPDRSSWEPPKREGPRPTFRASDEDVKRWLGAWFQIVDETPWDTKEARSRFVANWTATVAEWPANKQTESLKTMFARCTTDEAGYFLSQARAMVAAWEQGQAAEEAGEDEFGSDVGMTPVQIAEEVARQETPDPRPMADLTDEEIEARFEQATEQKLGRARATEQGPTRTQLLADLRKVVEEVNQSGGNVDLPDDLTQLDDDTVQTWTADLRQGLEGLKAAF